MSKDTLDHLDWVAAKNGVEFGDDEIVSRFMMFSPDLRLDTLHRLESEQPAEVSGTVEMRKMAGRSRLLRHLDTMHKTLLRSGR